MAYLSKRATRNHNLLLLLATETKNIYVEPIEVLIPYVMMGFQFYKHCDRWQKQVKKNPDTYKEMIMFSNSKEMNETLVSVAKRLGLDKAVTLGLCRCGYVL